MLGMRWLAFKSTAVDSLVAGLCPFAATVAVCQGVSCEPEYTELRWSTTQLSYSTRYY